MGTYGEQSKGVSTKHVGSHRHMPQHVKAEPGIVTKAIKAVTKKK